MLCKAYGDNHDTSFYVASQNYLFKTQNCQYDINNILLFVHILLTAHSARPGCMMLTARDKSP